MMSAFPPQGGMPQHPGMHPGQPMPGGVPHPQSMGGPMQMHPGIAGPHGQQVSQAPMMGMQPGMMQPGGPSAQAMQHLMPQGGQMMHHQQGMQMTPQMMQMSEQQRRVLYQQQMMRQRMAQGQMPQGQPGGFNQQQIAAMQASGQLGNLPPHMQQQMANTQMLHQQQAAMEAARQQQHHMATQHAQAQHLAMQQANSQGSNHGHPSSQPGQPNQPPMRPASAMAMTTGMEARPSPAPTAGPQGGPQPGPQVSQPPNQPNQQPQTSGPQGPQPQVAPSQPQPNQAPNNPQQGGGPQPQNQGQNRPQMPQNMNPQQMQAAQQAAMLRGQQAAAQAQAARANSGQTLLLAFHFANKLGAFRADQQQNSIAHWTQFVQQHFTEDAIYRMVLRYGEDTSSKQFEVHATGLPRYLYTQFESEIDQVQLVLDGNQEKRLDENHTVVRADRSRMLHWFRDGTQLVWNGVFQVMYNGDKIEQFNFETREHQTYYPRSKLAELCEQASPNQNRSPKMTKKSQQQGNRPQEPQFDLRKLPATNITPFGIHAKMQTWLELAETMNAMTPLITFSRDHPELSVPQALRSLVESYAQSAQQMAQAAAQQQNPNGGPGGGPVQGAFPPGGVQGPRMGVSPALSNAGLPVQGQANGATPSPSMNHMAPPMAPSMSQTSHASGSGGVNTSPNQQGAAQGGNKRRRSTAQGMKDGDGGEANGTVGGGGKVKQSPRMASGNKRMKGS